MEQQREDPSGTAPDSVKTSSTSAVERHFWPILLGVALLGIGASAAAVYAQYGRVDQALNSIPYVDRAGQLATQTTNALPYLGSADSLDATAGEPREYGSFTRIKGLVVNPAGSDGRYLAISIAFESKSSSVKTELADKKVVVKDAVLSLLSEQTAEELSAPDQRDELKDDLLKETNRILSSGTVDHLYFTEFVLQ